MLVMRCTNGQAHDNLHQPHTNSVSAIAVCGQASQSAVPWWQSKPVMTSSKERLMPATFRLLLLNKTYCRLHEKSPRKLAKHGLYGIDRQVYHT